MPYIVTPEQGTTLWADYQKTQEKGIVSKRTVFISDERNIGYNVHKTNYVAYTPKNMTGVIYGDGWIEADNVIKHFVADINDYLAPNPVQLDLPGFEGTYEVTIKKIK